MPKNIKKITATGSAALDQILPNQVENFPQIWLFYYLYKVVYDSAITLQFFRCTDHPELVMVLAKLMSTPGGVFMMRLDSAASENVIERMIQRDGREGEATVLCLGAASYQTINIGAQERRPYRIRSRRAS